MLNWAPLLALSCSTSDRPPGDSFIHDMELREEWQDEEFPRSDWPLTSFDTEPQHIHTLPSPSLSLNLTLTRTQPHPHTHTHSQTNRHTLLCSNIRGGCNNPNSTLWRCWTVELIGPNLTNGELTARTTTAKFYRLFSVTDLMSQTCGFSTTLVWSTTLLH
jgi:hypothetical protein